jgi:hypothetical protein
MKDPYNKPSKDKVTLSFAGLLCNPKIELTWRWHPAQNTIKPLENEVDTFRVQAKHFRMNHKISAQNRPR